MGVSSVSAKKFYKILKKNLVYSILIIPNSSATRVKSCYIPFPLALFIITFIVFNIYIFFGYSAQIWQISVFRRDIAVKSHLIAKLRSEKSRVMPVLEKNNLISQEVSRLVQGQERLDKTLNRIREKKGRSALLASRGLFVRTRPYELTTIPEMKDPITALDKLHHNLGELDNYIQEEKQAQNKLLEELLAYEYRLDHTPTIWPVHSTIIICNFGMRLHPIFRKYRPHWGLDIKADYGTPIAAAADGIVSFAGWESGYGYLVKINHGNGYETRYGHNSHLSVTVGQKVKKGQKIALAGATGDATGPHCHYEVRVNNTPINPRPFLQN
jgi:murein DD-endopeptidase MepM/ murein hydrolase activator NlpD